MNKAYRTKLVRLAKEIIELNKPIISTVEQAESLSLQRDWSLNSKLNYMLGYIMALEEVENPDLLQGNL